MARDADDKTYTAEGILQNARMDNLRQRVFDDLFPQFQSLLTKLAHMHDKSIEGDTVELTHEEAALAYRLIMDRR